jgi:hypothetical protein
VLATVVATAIVAATPAARDAIAWADLPPAVRPLLEARGLTSAGFPAFVAHVRETTAARVREGELDHVIFYALQSTHFTALPPIEPALSAKALVDSLDTDGRTRFHADPVSIPLANIPAAVDHRIAALLAALDAAVKRPDDAPPKPPVDARLQLFGEVLQTGFPNPRERRVGLQHAYLRAMRFLYEKEFEARAAARASGAAGTTAATAGAPDVARLYQTRGLSTDTAVEAGFLVHLGLATMHALDASYRVRRALIVGPGLDLAPRTGLLEAAPPQSYQPWAVIDALVSLGLSRLDDLQVTAADVNPFVVDHVIAASRAPPTLVLLSGIANDGRTTLTDDYRDYFTQLGRAIGREAAPPRVDIAHAAHLHKTVQVDAAAARTLTAEPLDLVTDRLSRRFDLIVITNVLPYLDDRELIVALANVAAMLEPGGVLLHNEPRPLVGDATARLELPFVHARNAIIANVRGAPTPLYDNVFIHRRARSSS